jgi:hypothetical protein
VLRKIEQHDGVGDHDADLHQQIGEGGQIERVAATFWCDRLMRACDTSTSSRLESRLR